MSYASLLVIFVFVALTFSLCLFLDCSGGRVDGEKWEWTDMYSERWRSNGMYCLEQNIHSPASASNQITREKMVLLFVVPCQLALLLRETEQSQVKTRGESPYFPLSVVYSVEVVVGGNGKSGPTRLPSPLDPAMSLSPCKAEPPAELMDGVGHGGLFGSPVFTLPRPGTLGFSWECYVLMWQHPVAKREGGHKFPASACRNLLSKAAGFAALSRDGGDRNSLERQLGRPGTGRWVVVDGSNLMSKRYVIGQTTS